MNNPREHAGGVPVFCRYDEILPVAKIKPNPRNPNQHPENQLEMLVKIIEKQGWRAPISIGRRSGYVVRGHARLHVAKVLGGFAPVEWQEYDSDESEIADLIADNRIAELAVLSEEQLAELLREIDASGLGLDLTGYGSHDVDRLLQAVETKEDVNPDAAVEIPEEPISKLGDVWKLGEHRIMCGDSTDASMVKKLCNSHSPTLMVTDSPCDAG